MKKNNYNIEKIIDYLYNHGLTNFINQKDLTLVKGKLNKNEYHIYEPYKECNKIILYKKDLPKIKLYKIKSSINLRHQDILGSIFSLGLSEDTFGDIFKYQGEYYIFILNQIEEYLKYNFLNIKNNKITLEEVPLDISNNFIQEFIPKEIIVSSLRIDNIVASLIHTNRNEVLTKFKNKEIILNYNEDVKPTKILKENDIFSIKKIGKFKFSGIIKNTKKGGYIVRILMYK